MGQAKYSDPVGQEFVLKYKKNNILKLERNTQEQVLKSRQNIQIHLNQSKQFKLD